MRSLVGRGTSFFQRLPDAWPSGALDDDETIGHIRCFLTALRKAEADIKGGGKADGNHAQRHEEYLHTQFDGPDREYVDGGVVERNTGELPHAILQADLIYILLRGTVEVAGLRGDPMP